MSRWTRPRAWAAASARATPAPMRATWRGGSVPLRRRIVARSSPSIELHDDVRAARVLAVVVDGDDVRVAQRGGGLGLLAEARREVGVAQVLGTQELERDVATEPGVRGAVDGRHPALAEQLDQPVAAAQDLPDLRQVVPSSSDRVVAGQAVTPLRGIVPHGAAASELEALAGRPGTPCRGPAARARSRPRP